MDIETNHRNALKAFNNANGIIITVGLPNKVKIIHGMEDFGNIIVHSDSKVCGHIGMNEIAFVGLIDHAEDLTFIEYDLPLRNEFEGCITLEAMQGLQPQGITTGWNYEGRFFPIPFVQRAIIQSGSSCPIELIFVAQEAYTAYVLRRYIARGRHDH